jgi:antitoxin component YwqK of YwqJK toxin-antitoxin module
MNRFIMILIVFAVLCMPAFGQTTAIFDSWNGGSVDNNPTSSASFTISEPHLITYIDTYHYNSGQGVSAGGTISLKRDDGEIFGPWTVTAESGSGAANAWWKCLPYVVIPAGTYTIIDSEPETWSMNTESNGCGFSKVEGHPEYSVSVSEPDRIENVAQEEAADVSLDSGKETEAAMKAGTFQLPKCPMIKTPDEPNPYGAPLMQNPEIASGAKCRGACGEDCPSDRCKSVPDVEIPVDDSGELVCVYRGVIECPTHQGCRDHDACYDKCAEEGHTVVFKLPGGPDECHSACNQECYDKWGKCQCAAWADILPSQIQGAVEYGCENKFDGGLKFFWGEPQIKMVQKSTSICNGIDYSKLKKVEKPYLVYFVDSDGKYWGIFKGYYDTDRKKLKTEGCYIDGLKNGNWIEYYENGNIRWEGNYINDTEDGRFIEYYENGMKSREGYLKGIKWTGHWVWYQYPNGTKHEEVDYIEGNRTGHYIKYDKNGQKYNEGDYENDKKNGNWIWYNYDDGSIQFQANYRNGQWVSGDYIPEWA